MSKCWFYDLNRQPDKDFIDSIPSICFGVDVVERCRESDVLSRQTYETIVLRRGFDRMRIVVGAEPAQIHAETDVNWWILVTCEPWWRNWFNTIPRDFLPKLEEKIKTANLGARKG